MKTYKVVVTGPFNVGKTEFIRSISDIEIVTTERRISDPQIANTVKEETTVAMDYGQKRIGESMFHLYGTPGQARFEFMWKILAKEMDAFLLLVDSTDKGSLMEVMQIIRLFRKYAKVPYVIVANKQDGESALTPQQIGKSLAVSKEIPIVPCVARDSASVLDVLKQVQAVLI